MNSVPTLRGFIARTRRVYNIELHIAREKNKLLEHCVLEVRSVRS